MAITTLIDKLDTVERVRDRIAEILVTETAAQVALARAATPAKDSKLWDLRVFVDRANPWADFIDAETGNLLDACPVVNVSFSEASYDMRKGDVVERQQATGTFNIDVYGYGISQDDGAGHLAGDAIARAEALRGTRLVRNILMAAEHTYLGMRGVVGRRWPQSLEVLDIDTEGRTVAYVVAARLKLDVDFLEFSPQVEGPPLESIYATVRRRDTNEIYLAAEYDLTGGA